MNSKRMKFDWLIGLSQLLIASPVLESHLRYPETHSLYPETPLEDSLGYHSVGRMVGVRADKDVDLTNSMRL